MKRGAFPRLIKAWLLVSVLGGCAHAAQDHGPADPAAASAVTVYVVSHGWHTGIVIAGHDLGPELGFLERYFEPADWYEIGWGDKEFYQAEEVTTGLTLRAGLLPTDAVLHVAALPRRPQAYFGNSRVIELRIDATGLEHLTASIAAYFRRAEHGDPLTQGKGLYGQSRFFAASGRFHAFNTCNTWTARMLDRAGIPIRTFMTLRAGSVMGQLESIAVSDTGAPD